jgi:hypothetical protein
MNALAAVILMALTGAVTAVVTAVVDGHHLQINKNVEITS